MDHIFKHLLELKGVGAVRFFSREGRLVYRKYQASLVELKDRMWPEGEEGRTLWKAMVTPFADVGEAELVFQRRKLFIRMIDLGTILVVMDRDVSSAMVRLNCDILVPDLTANSVEKETGQPVRLAGYDFRL